MPYWGKYVFHDNNRDINLSQLSMRALADFYFTAYPPIMHDLHESLPLLYTYSGAAPQNPNLDPDPLHRAAVLLELRAGADDQVGMPGVYTHAFMDGWSPGYLGSVAYNHNGMMRMYETQSGSEPAAAGRGRAVAARGCGGCGRRCAGVRAADGVPDEAGGEGAGSAQGERGAGSAQGARGAGSAAQARTRPRAGGRRARRSRGGSGPSTGRGGGQDREWYRGIADPSGRGGRTSRAATTPTTCRPACSAGCSSPSMFPNLVLENFYRKTPTRSKRARTIRRTATSSRSQRDMTRVATSSSTCCASSASRSGRRRARSRPADGTFPAGSYVIKRDQPYGRLAKNLLERQDYPDPNLRTYDDSGWTMGLASLVDVKEIKDKAILSVATTPVKEAVAKGQGQRQRFGRRWRSRTSDPTT